jgi:general secretion pathway protein K
VALAIVVWFLAAMSLLVSGIVFQARSDTRMAQLHLAKAKAVAAGDGAIQLFLAELHAGRGGKGVPLAREYRIGDRSVRVEVVSAQGLIDLASAPQQTLADMFRVRGAMGEKEAQTLAANVIKSRPGAFGARRRGGDRGRISAIEDLLRVKGIDRRLLDATRDLVTVGEGGSRGGVARGSAPPAVLAVLAAGDRQRSAEVAREGRPGARTGKRAQPLPARGSLRVDALVRDNGRTWLRRRWVEMGGGAEGALPWEFKRTEAARVVAAG